ncbi:hypothetical protein QBC43DRAFT_307094 [Cladorrhinum sp. PSN259]|nr:hypothetical protein QBC43DRAFT_307094 [Cladorrhinum sp. PSN259]
MSRQNASPKGTDALPPPPPSQIQPTSPLSPCFRQCCHCAHTTTTVPPSPSSSSESLSSNSCSCSHTYCRQCPDLDSRGQQVIPHSFPVHWICSTCDTTHSVVELLTQTELGCDGCDKPTLEAVYDQFGRIFLYWRQDPSVYDLSEKGNVREAAWRVWEAGAGMLMDGLTRGVDDDETATDVVMEDVTDIKNMKILGRQNRGWSQLSHSSISSEDSLDVALIELGVVVAQ